MKPREHQRQGVKLSLALHGTVLALMLAGSLVHKLWPRQRQPERLVFVDFTVSVPPPPAPETPEQPKPEPPPPPEPDPDEIAMPAKKPPEPKPPAPKKDIRQTNRVTKTQMFAKAPPPKDKPLSAEEIAALLKKGARIGETTSIPDDDQIALGAYYNHVHERMYAVWQQPVALKNLPGLSTAASITVAPGGQVSGRHLTRRSGNELMDDSVMQALNSVGNLRALPAGFRKPVEIEIVFEIKP